MSKDTMTGATVAITGGTGSFGSTMVSHLLRRGVDTVLILSRDETKQDEMRKRFSDSRLRFFLGDVRDYNSVAGAFVGTDFVFHAAALKQVPSCEFLPEQAVKTNVVGSYNVIEAAAKAGVQAVVCLSTDKAVYPVNAMGMTEALMEKPAQAFARNHARSKTIVSITRYGNVMYSRGSVILLFVQQLQSGKSVTLTEPKMTRFLMTLQESVDLVEHAFLNAEPGDLFVRKAPACTVEVLATAVANLLGNQGPEVKLIDTRHGRSCMRPPQPGGNIRVPLDARSLEYELFNEQGEVDAANVGDYTSANTVQLDVKHTKELLQTIPEMRELLERGNA